MEVVVFGAGVMGSSFAHTLARGGHEVQLCLSAIDHNQNPELLEKKRHNQLGPLFPSINVTRGKVHRAQSLIVIAVSSPGLTWAWNQLQSQPTHVPVLFLSKGLLNINKRLYTLPAYFDQLCSDIHRAPNPWQVFSGPCLAQDLFHNHPVQVLIGGDLQTLHQTHELIQNIFPALEKSDDPIGASYCSALKNIYAIILSAVRKSSPSLAGGLFPSITSELCAFLKHHHCDEKTAWGLAGIGDLYLTSFGGRNGLLGERLSETGTIEGALDALQGTTLEGYELAKTLDPALRETADVSQKYPILMAGLDVLIRKKKFELNDFMPK